MNTLIEITNRDRYLVVKVLEPWTFEVAKRVIDNSKQAAVKQGYNCILFDLTEWVQPDREMTRFRSGEYLASQFPQSFKIAAFAFPESINKFGENTAVNRGVQFRIFSDEKNAIAWLLETQ